MSASASASYASVTVDASIKVEGEVEAELNTKTVEEQTEEGTIGDRPILETVFGISALSRCTRGDPSVTTLVSRLHCPEHLAHMGCRLRSRRFSQRVASRGSMSPKGAQVAGFYAYVSGHQVPEVTGEKD
ncbi:hypothetical protein BDW42DRAFT_195217 [Aspergillus taichungensis]|uniref:Uncharacterized protein n=1 Tax=Aspergillus taichungensis TaxID=482145 RepID=A0A2J5HQ29_9EURO|nr:hypothetical protein BDW42DRAFT_195217 [Aspergillus taichungensis]